MLTRRHIRVKVLQSLYAFYQTEAPSLDKQEKFLLYSINQMQDLHALMLQLLVAMRDHADAFLQVSQKKHLATDLEKNPSRRFIDNKVIDLIAQSEELSEFVQNKKIKNWDTDTEYISLLFNELKEKEWYAEYLEKKTTSFKEDQKFLAKLYKDVIAPNDKLYDYLEDNRLTWLDDFPLVNTSIMKMLDKVSEKNTKSVFTSELFKDDEDRAYALDLLRKVILNDDALSAQVDGKTPNWDKERIAEMDMIILKMGIAEFLHFSSIPVKVTINEYLEIAKEYSTPKSSLFINGILDKLVKDLTNADQLNKIGRGLR